MRFKDPNLSRRPAARHSGIECWIVVSFSAGKRSPIVPDLSIIAEAGVPGFKANQWHGAVTSAKMHPAIVRKIYDALRAPDVAERLAGDA